MIEFGRKVKGHGLDAMQIYSLDMGHLGIPRPQEQEHYFRDVLEHIDMPSVISTHFSVGYMVPVDLLCALCAEYPHVIGINVSIGQDFTYLVRVLDEVPAHVEVHVGGPMHTLSTLAMGGTGFLSSEAQSRPAARELRRAALRRWRLRGRGRHVHRRSTRLHPPRLLGCRRRRCCGRSGCPAAIPACPACCSRPRTTRRPASPSSPRSASPSSRIFEGGSAGVSVRDQRKSVGEVLQWAVSGISIEHVFDADVFVGEDPVQGLHRCLRVSWF